VNPKQMPSRPQLTPLARQTKIHVIPRSKIAGPEKTFNMKKLQAAKTLKDTQ
jgi:hypothetical protein